MNCLQAPQGPQKSSNKSAAIAIAVNVCWPWKENVHTNLKYPLQLLFSCRVIVSHGLYTINEHILNAKMRKMRW